MHVNIKKYIETKVETIEEQLAIDMQSLSDSDFIEAVEYLQEKLHKDLERMKDYKSKEDARLNANK